MQNFKLLSWNVQGKLNFTGYTDFKRVLPDVLKSSADIIALQEICDAEMLVKKVKVLENYNIFIPKLNKQANNRKEGHNYNILLSKYPILHAEELVFPKFAGKNNLENCIKADIGFNNQTLRIYNCHFPVFRVGMATRINQLKFILDDCLSHEGPVVICGDLNSTLPKSGWRRFVISLWHQQPRSGSTVFGKFIKSDEKEVFNEIITKYGFREILDLETSTWSPIKSKIWEPFNLKLDWMIVKDLNVVKHTLADYISDHKAIEIECRME